MGEVGEYIADVGLTYLSAGSGRVEQVQRWAHGQTSERLCGSTCTDHAKKNLAKTSPQLTGTL